MSNAIFQQRVNLTPAGVPTYLIGDLIGNKNFQNPAQSAIVNIASSVPQAIGSFTWRKNAQTCTPLKADSTGALLGFVARTQDTTWANSNVDQGWSMQVAQGYQLQYFASGTVATVCPSLNNAGAGPILYGDLILINDLTGELASQTTDVIPSGYTQVITNNLPWKVIDTSIVYDAQGSQIANLVAISNIQNSI